MSLLSAISTVLRFLLLLVVPGVLGLVVWLFTAIDLLRAHVAPAIGRSDRRRNAEGTLGDDFGHTLDRAISMVARLLAMLLLFPWYAAEIPEAFVLALAALEEVIDTLAHLPASRPGSRRSPGAGSGPGSGSGPGAGSGSGAGSGPNTASGSEPQRTANFD